MSKPIAVFDIDGTIFRSNLVIELTEQLVKDGVFPKKIYKEFDEEYQQWRNRTGGYENYAKSVMIAFDKYLENKKLADVQASARKLVKNTQLHTYRFTRKLLEDLKDEYFLAAISGSPIFVVEIFAESYGFDASTGTEHEIKNGKLGKVIESGDGNKKAKLEQLLDKHSLTLKNSVGVGDTETDISFLETVEKSVAFNPNQNLLSIAQKQNWDIFVERKDVIYHLNCSEKDGCRLFKTE